MLQTIIGILAFALFFVGDYNDWRLSNPVLKFCFPAGVLMLMGVTVYGAIRGNGIRRTWMVFPALLFLVLLVYALFFAIPAEDAYISQHNGRKVCSTGMYAVCRHPGVLCFLGLYICFYLMGIVCSAALVSFNVLNLLLVIFEDAVVFPDVIDGYRQYKKEVPFILPVAKYFTVHL